MVQQQPLLKAMVKPFPFLDATWGLGLERNDLNALTTWPIFDMCRNQVYCWDDEATRLVMIISSNSMQWEPVFTMIKLEGAKVILVPYLLLPSSETLPATCPPLRSGPPCRSCRNLERSGPYMDGCMHDLSDPTVKKEDARGYKNVLEFSRQAHVNFCIDQHQIR
ncbi:hypothetical protein CRV24_010041 [Beauveria bassiana]|nr:hypothetical protein CRV24_010041 [Beauveria bassiana]